MKIFLSQIESAKMKGIVKNGVKNIFDSYSRIINTYIKRLKYITLNLFGILTCSVLTCKNHSKVPSTIYTQDYSHVLRGKKIMIMSATLDKNVHLELFRKRINVNTEWIDLPRTEIKGKIICHTDFSTTRNAFSRYSERINIIKSQIEKLGNIDQVITYKDLKEEFGSVSHMHFYNTAGYNDYSGKNLAIVGTPNNLPENVVTLHYLIYGEVPKSLKFDEENNEVSYYLSNQAMIKDEYKFSFFTFSHTEDENVRAIHSWFTYNELLQAVGRARLTHHDCEVHVFSRLPIPQCVLAHELES